MLGLGAGLLFGLAAATPHPGDRPLADLTLEVVGSEVVATVLLNFQFIDLVLGTSGDPVVPPTSAEVASAERALEELFGDRNRLYADGATLAPRYRDDFLVAEPLPVLREAAPGYVRALTQVRFSIAYALTRPLGELKVTWGFYPEHPLTEAKDSPMVSMKMRAVVVKPGGAAVLDLEQAAPTASIVLDERHVVAPAAATAEERGVATSPSWWWFGGGALAVLLLFAVFGRLARGAVALLAALPLLIACGPGELVQQVATDDWEVELRVTPAPIPVNQHFEAEISVRGRADGELPGSVNVDADMPAHGHGMNTAPRLTSLGEGRWRVEGLLFHMPGSWELYVDVGEGQQLQRAAFPVELK